MTPRCSRTLPNDCRRSTWRAGWTGCSRSRSGTSAKAGWCWAATGWGRSRCSTGIATVGLCSAARSRPCSSTPPSRGELDRRRDTGLPHVRLRAYAADVLRRHPEPPARPRPDVRAWERTGRRALLGAAARERERSQPFGCLARRGGARGPLSAGARRPAAAHLRRSAWCVPERRNRLQRGRRADGRPDGRAGQDLHDRLRGSRRLRRAAVRERSSPSDIAPTTTSSSSIPTQWTSLERLVWHHDQPFGDSSAIPTFLLSEVTARHVTVALSGDGGDELFAGYERFAAGLAAAALFRDARPPAGRGGRPAEAAPGRFPAREGPPAPAFRGRRRPRPARRLPLLDQLRR